MVTIIEIRKDLQNLNDMMGFICTWNTCWLYATWGKESCQMPLDKDFTLHSESMMLYLDISPENNQIS